jgi:hypothetical protein
MTAKIKLNAASGGGSISIQAPSSSSNNRVISLPDIADGTLVTSQSTLDATKLSGNLPALNGSALTNLPAGGKFASYAVIGDQKGTNTSGGSSTSGAFYTRDLNTIFTDPDTIVSISSNQFTLQAGTYLISASAPAYKASRHQIIIWNATDSSIVAVGTSEYCGGSESVQSRSFAQNKTTISGAKAFEIRHRVGGSNSTYGLGIESNYDTLASIYTMVEIFKES